MERTFNASVGVAENRKGLQRDIFVPEPLLDSWEAAAMMKVLRRRSRSSHVKAKFRAFMLESFGASGHPSLRHGSISKWLVEIPRPLPHADLSLA